MAVLHLASARYLRFSLIFQTMFHWRATCKEIGSTLIYAKESCKYPHPHPMKIIRITLVSLIIVAVADATSIKSSSNGESTKDAANNFPLKTDGPSARNQRNSAASYLFLVERPSWSAPIGAPQYSIDGIKISDSRFPAWWKQSGKRIGKFNLTKRQFSALSYRQEPVRVSFTVASTINAVQRVPDSGGSFAFLGLSLLGLGSASRLFRRFA